MLMVMLISWCVWCQEDSATTGPERYFLCPPLANMRQCCGIFQSPPASSVFIEGWATCGFKESRTFLSWAHHSVMLTISKFARTAAANPYTASTALPPPKPSSRQVLTSELEGLAVSVTSLERQLADRESVCDGLKRQLEAEAGGDSSARENELARQV